MRWVAHKHQRHDQQQWQHTQNWRQLVRPGSKPNPRASAPTLRKLSDHAKVVLGLEGIQHGDDVWVLQLAQDLNLLQAKRSR